MTLKLGDIVEYEEKEWTLVDWDEINEQWVGEDADGERQGFAEDNLEEMSAEPASPTGMAKPLKSNAELSIEFKNQQKKMAADAARKKEEDKATKKWASRFDNKNEEVEELEEMGSKTPKYNTDSVQKEIDKDKKIKSKKGKEAKRIHGLLKGWRKEEVEENEENSTMEELQIGDVVVYEDLECLVIECDDPEAIILENEDGEQFTIQLDELTKAGETIKGKANYNTSQMTASVIKSFAGMSASDQVDFYNKMMSQYGKGKDWGIGSVAGKNKSSIDANNPNQDTCTPGQMAGKVKALGMAVTREDLDKILDGEELSEEIKEKAAVLFEAAVNLRVSAVEAELKDFYEEDLETRFAEFTEEMEEQIDHYLSYVSENWVAENEVAIESNLKNELAESLINGLHGLLKEHYIDIPEEQIDVVETLTDKVTQLEDQLNEQIESNIDLVEAVEQHNQEQLFNEVADGLAVTQMEKFRTLTEGVEFNGDQDDYRNKLEIVRKKYFQNQATTSTLEEEVILEDAEDGDAEPKKSVNIDPNVAMFAEAITRTQNR
jgi:hypothetical protein